MKILLVADACAEIVRGGVEQILAHHVSALAEVHDLTVLTRQPAPEAPLTREVADGVTEYRIPCSGHQGLAGMRELKQGAKDWWRPHQGEFDALVSEQPFVMWALLRAGCRLPRLQVCHSFAFEEYGIRHGPDWGVRHKIVTAVIRDLERRVYAPADGLLVLSRFMRDHLNDCFHLNHPHITVTPGGVSSVPLASREERARLRKQFGWQGPVVITLCDLVPQTGVDMLVQAAAMLRHAMPYLRWIVMGSGVLMEPLKWLTEQLDVADRIEFTGYLPENEVLSRMHAADVFMLPARSPEGFGLAATEANANGLPVAGTPTGSNSEGVDASADNILTDAITPEALAEATRLLLERGEDHMDRAGRLHAHVKAHHNWQQHDEALMRAISALVC